MEDNTPQQSHDRVHVQAPLAQPGQHASVPGSTVMIAADGKKDDIVSWEASEYIHHEKGTGWYVVFLLTWVVLAGLLFYFVDVWALIIASVMAVALIVYAQRKPDILRYTLSEDGISIGDKVFSFDDFRSFTIMQEEGIFSVVLDPVRRFMPPVSIYFAESDGEQIVGLLSQILPHQEK